MRKIIEKIESCRTMTHLNFIRDEVFEAMTTSKSDEDRKMIQKAFRTQKNRIKARVYGREEYPWQNE